MNKLLQSVLFAFASFAILTPSAAAVPVGTFCSVRTEDGVWAMNYGPDSMAYNCAVARRAVASVTSLPIADSNSGYYEIYGVNRVLTSCGFAHTQIISSYGANALQNAVSTASYSGLTYCLFAVNHL